MPRLWAKTVSFDSVSVGDDLPILVKWETEETIQRFSELVPPDSSPATPKEPAQQKVNVTLATLLTAYVAELLEKGFKLPNIVAKGSGMELEINQGVNADDTLVLSGSVVGKKVEQDLRLIQCSVIIENQSGETVAVATATVSL